MASMTKDKTTKGGVYSQAERQHIVVLNPARHSQRWLKYFPPPGDAALQGATHHNTADGRRLVRRQAALASAGNRKATTAATRDGKKARKKRQPSTDETHRRSVDGEGEGEGEGKKDEDVVLPSTRVSPKPTTSLGGTPLGPFPVLPIDLAAIGDSGLAHSLFNFFMAVDAPIFDLRLTTKRERNAGLRYTWQKNFPDFAFRYPPCFWTMLCIASAQMNIHRSTNPLTDPVTVGLYQRAVQCVNEQVRSMQSITPDVGLLISVCLMGVWEWSFGSFDAWMTHREGMRAFGALFDETSDADEIRTDVLIFGTRDKSRGVSMVDLDKEDQMKDPDFDLKGFRDISKMTYMAEDVVGALQNCQIIDTMVLGDAREKLISRTASMLKNWSPCRTGVRVYARQGMTDLKVGTNTVSMHIVVQAAGVSMLAFLAGGVEQAGLDWIDPTSMCDEILEHVQKVVKIPQYYEVLLWAVITLCSLNRIENGAGLSLIHTLADRLGVTTSPTAWEVILRRFAFLQSARKDYQRLWYQYMLSLDERVLRTPELEGIEAGCPAQ